MTRAWQPGSLIRSIISFLSLLLSLIRVIVKSHWEARVGARKEEWKERDKEAAEGEERNETRILDLQSKESEKDESLLTSSRASTPVASSRTHELRQRDTHARRQAPRFRLDSSHPSLSLSHSHSRLPCFPCVAAATRAQIQGDPVQTSAQAAIASEKARSEWERESSLFSLCLWNRDDTQSLIRRDSGGNSIPRPSRNPDEGEGKGRRGSDRGLKRERRHTQRDTRYTRNP